MSGSNPFRAYSPAGANRSPTRRTQAGGYSGLQSMPGFEGWRAEGDVDRTPSHASTPGIVPEVVPKASPASNPFLSSSGAPTPSYSSASSYDLPPSLQAGSHSGGGSRRGSEFDPLAFDTPDSTTTFKRTSYRHTRTPSESSAESTSRSRDRFATTSSRRDRTPSRSPSRAIPPRDVGGTQRTPSGNVMASIFNAQNAAAVGSALGSAANFLGSRAGIIKPEGHADDSDSIPGGYNSRPVPDTVNEPGFNLGNAVNYLSNLASPPQTPAAAPPPPQQQGGGSPFTLSNALSYLQQATQQPAAGGGAGGGLPQNFQLAGIEIDFNWIAQKAGEQNPWVLLGGVVVAFWIISSIIATLLWYSVIAGVLYVVYVVGVKKGGFGAIGDTPPRRRVAGGGGGWTSSAGSRPGGAPEWRRRY
ncbi:hypothetical protein TWF696_008662 [Orbilia brochopaga]|uniref:Uncharacterized protein n=1 Tax=Orbilia brochopaga TaxID=3140254 RepID=A0AAV9UKF6_9PEZI